MSDFVSRLNRTRKAGKHTSSVRESVAKVPYVAAKTFQRDC